MTCSAPTSCTFDNHLIHEKTNLPSPPNSSCGDEREPELTPNTNTIPPPPITHYTTADLSENYTIDHSKLNIIEKEQYTLKLQKDNHVISSTTPSFTSNTTSSFSPSLKRSLPLSSDEEDSSDIDDSTETTKRKKPALSETHRCNDCGKLYKHLKSLFKHQWEHSEYWEASSKLSLTKHQQVQMLEAASILANMKKQNIINQDTDDSEEDNDHDEYEEGEISLM
jgi:hypothetical protein